MSTVPITRRRREQKIKVYNPTMYTDSVEVAGITYHFAPRGFAECVCADHQAGNGENLGVHASYDWPRDARNILITGGAKKVADDGKMTADAVAEMIVSPACRGEKFFIIVEGSRDEQERMMREAERKWAEAYIEEVEQVITQWERDIREAQLSQPGALPPRQPPHIKEAYRFRKLWNTNKLDRSDYVCINCGYDAKDKADLDRHVIDEHPGIASDRGLVAAKASVRGPRKVAPLAERVAATNAAQAAEDGADEAVPDGEAPGAEVVPGEGDTPDPEDEQETGEVVRRRAVRTGVDLSVAELRLLQVDDRDVIEDVQRRIRDLRSKRAEMVKAQQAKRGGEQQPTS